MSGVYIHIPFCKSKCPYCDFYSYPKGDKEKDEYVDALVDEIKTQRRVASFAPHSFKADSLYLGGGTPSVLSGEALFRIITAAREQFLTDENAEITVECNPNSDIEGILPHLKKAGVNRISLGMQSCVEKERRLLGRASDKERILQVIDLFRKNGIDNISLDIMLGIPCQTKESLQETLNFIKETGVPHVSAYILKIEENTHFYKNRDKYDFPDEDSVCDFYKQCSDFLTKNGYEHYEISNFSKKGFESRHNTKYWLLEDYLGIGPGAHSFVDGKRFYFESDTEKFISGNPPIYDGDGGDAEEFIMLSLRLKKGLDLDELCERYGESYLSSIKKKAPLLAEKGLINFDGNALSLTESGMLLSNSIIAEFIYF